MTLYFRLIYLAALLCSWFAAAAQTDSLTAGDTIRINHRQSFLVSHTLFGYYGANDLTSRQVWPLLLRMDDKQVRHLTNTAHRRMILTNGFALGSEGLLLGSLATFRNRNLAPYLLLGAFAGTIGNITTSLGIDPATRRAAIRYNTLIRSRTDGYAPPLVMNTYQPTVADTIQVIRKGLGYRFLYRGIRLNPGTQLKSIQLALNNPELNNGFRHSRTLRKISGITTVIGNLLLNLTLLRYAALTGYKQRLMPVDRQLYTSLGIIGTGVLIRHLADKSDVQAINRYNQLLRAERTWTNATY